MNALRGPPSGERPPLKDCAASAALVLSLKRYDRSVFVKAIGHGKVNSRRRNELH